MEHKIEFLPFPFVYRNVEYFLTNQGYYYANSRAAAYFGATVIDSFPSDLRANLYRDIKDKGLILLFEMGRTKQNALGGWIFDPDLRYALRDGGLTFPNRGLHLPYDGTLIKISADIGDVKFAGSVLCHEYRGHHGCFDQNFRSAGHLAPDLSYWPDAIELCDPAYWRHRRLAGQVLRRSELGNYFQDAQRYLSKNNIVSIFDIKSSSKKIPTPASLLFYRPAAYFAGGLADDLAKLSPWHENEIKDYTQSVLRKLETKIYQRDKYVFQEFTNEMCARYPFMHPKPVRKALSDNAKLFRQELFAHWSQAEHDYPGCTNSLAPRTTLFFDKLKQSEVISVPKFKNLSGYNFQELSFNRIASPFGSFAINGMKFLNPVLNTFDLYSVYSQEWNLAEVAYPHSVIPSTLLRGTSQFAVNGAYWSGVYYGAGPGGLALVPLMYLAETVDLEQMYYKENEPLEKLLAKANARNATFEERRQLLKEYYIEHPFADPEMASGIVMQKLLKAINLPARYQDWARNIAEQTPEYQRHLAEKNAYLEELNNMDFSHDHGLHFPNEPMEEIRPNPLIYAIDGRQPNNPTKHVVTGNSPIPNTTHYQSGMNNQRESAASKIAAVNFKTDRRLISDNDLALKPGNNANPNLDGDIQTTPQGHDKPSMRPKHRQIAPSSNSLLPKNDNDILLYATKTGTGLAMTVFSGGVVSFTIDATGAVVTTGIELSSEFLGALTACAPYMLAFAAVAFVGFKVANLYFKNKQHKINKMVKHSKAEMTAIIFTANEINNILSDKKFKKWHTSSKYENLLTLLRDSRRELIDGSRHESRRADRSHNMGSRSYHAHNSAYRNYRANLFINNERIKFFQYRHDYFEFVEDHTKMSSRHLVKLGHKLSNKQPSHFMGLALKLPYTTKDVANLEGLKFLLNNKVISSSGAGKFGKAQRLLEEMSEFSYYAPNQIPLLNFLDCGPHELNKTSQGYVDAINKYIEKVNLILATGGNADKEIVALQRYINQYLLPEFHYRLKRAPRHQREEITSSKDISKPVWGKRTDVAIGLYVALEKLKNEGNKPTALLTDNKTAELLESFVGKDDKSSKYWFNKLKKAHKEKKSYSKIDRLIIKGGCSYHILKCAYQKMAKLDLVGAEEILAKHMKYYKKDNQNIADLKAVVMNFAADLDKGATHWLGLMRESKAIPKEKQSSANQAALVIGPNVVYMDVAKYFAKDDFPSIKTTLKEMKILRPEDKRLIANLTGVMEFIEKNQNQDYSFWLTILKNNPDITDKDKHADSRKLPRNILRGKSQDKVLQHVIELNLSDHKIENLTEADKIMKVLEENPHNKEQVNSIQNRILSLRSGVAEAIKNNQSVTDYFVNELEKFVNISTENQTVADHAGYIIIKSKLFQAINNLAAEGYYNDSKALLAKIEIDKSIPQLLINAMVKRLDAKHDETLEQLYVNLDKLSDKRKELSKDVDKTPETQKAPYDPEKSSELFQLNESICIGLMTTKANDLIKNSYNLQAAKVAEKLEAYSNTTDDKKISPQLYYEHEGQVVTTFGTQLHSFLNVYAERTTDSRRRKLRYLLETVNGVQIILPNATTLLAQGALSLHRGDTTLFKANLNSSLSQLRKSFTECSYDPANVLMWAQAAHLLSRPIMRMLNVRRETRNAVQNYGGQAIQLGRIAYSAYRLWQIGIRNAHAVSLIFNLLHSAHGLGTAWIEHHRERNGQANEDPGNYYSNQQVAATLDFAGNVGYLWNLYRSYNPVVLLNTAIAGSLAYYCGWSTSAHQMDKIRGMFAAINNINYLERFVELEANIDNLPISIVATEPTAATLPPHEFVIYSTQDGTRCYYKEIEPHTNIQTITTKSFRDIHHWVISDILSRGIREGNIIKVDPAVIKKIKTMLLPYITNNNLVFDYLLNNRMIFTDQLDIANHVSAVTRSKLIIVLTNSNPRRIYFAGRRNNIMSVEAQHLAECIAAIPLGEIGRNLLRTNPVIRKNYLDIITMLASYITHSYIQQSRSIIQHSLVNEFGGYNYTPYDAVNRARGYEISCSVRDRFRAKDYPTVLRLTTHVSLTMRNINNSSPIPAYYLWHAIIANRLETFIVVEGRINDFKAEYCKYSDGIVETVPDGQEDELSDIRKAFRNCVKKYLYQCLELAQKSEGNERLESLYMMMGTYSYVGEWSGVLDDKEKLLAASLALQANSPYLARLFYRKISNINSLFTDDESRLRILLILAVCDLPKHDLVCSDAQRVRYGITNTLFSSYISFQLFEENYPLAWKLLQTQSEFEQKHYFRGICIFKMSHHLDVLDAIKALLNETRRDLPYWKLLHSLAVQVLAGTNYIGHTVETDRSRLKIYFLIKLCLDKIIALHNVANLDSSALRLNLTNVEHNLDIYHARLGRAQQQPLNYVEISAMFNLPSLNAQTFIEGLFQGMTERCSYNQRIISAYMMEVPSNGECFFDALGTTRENAINLLRSHVLQQQQQNARQASRPIEYMLMHLSPNKDNPVQFNHDCFPEIIRLIDRFAKNGEWMEYDQNVVGICNAIAYLMNVNLCIYTRAEDRRLTLVSDQRDDGRAGFENIFLLHTTYSGNDENEFQRNHYVRMMLLEPNNAPNLRFTHANFFRPTPLPQPEIRSTQLPQQPNAKS